MLLLAYKVNCGRFLLNYKSFRVFFSFVSFSSKSKSMSSRQTHDALIKMSNYLVFRLCIEIAALKLLTRAPHFYL